MRLSLLFFISIFYNDLCAVKSFSRTKFNQLYSKSQIKKSYVSQRRLQPTAILGGLLKKDESKEFPELNLEAEQDPGIKVTPSAWKWPATWPYTPDYFDVISSLNDAEFFEKKNEGARDFFTADSQALVQEHLKRFLPSHCRILDIGAGSNSYLPPESEIPVQSLVGLGLSPSSMSKNPRLSETIVKDLNAEPLLPFPDKSFDAVLISNSIEFLKQPLEVFREVHRVLRLGGRAFILFTAANEYKDFEDKQIKLWRTMNDAQHMWICGSYFKFAADFEFSDLKGYELSPEQNAMEKAMGAKQPVFVVQAMKTSAPTIEEDAEAYFLTKVWEIEGVEVNEKRLMAARFAAGYNRASTDTEKEQVANAWVHINPICQVLRNISDDVIFPPLKAKLAVMLASKLNNPEPMLNQLQQGLGLIEPSESFWVPLGQATRGMDPENKVMLIADMVPFLGGTLEEQALAEKMVQLLPSVTSLIKEKQPEWRDSDCQLLGVDLAITDYLYAKSDEHRQTFLDWVQTLSVGALELFLDQRKNYNKV